VRLGNGLDGCGCNNGLSGMGLTADTPTGVVMDCSGLPILERLACEARKLLSRTREISSPVPIYTPPAYPSTYPGTYEGYAAQETNWTPILLGGLLLFALMRRR